MVFLTYCGLLDVTSYWNCLLSRYIWILLFDIFTKMFRPFLNEINTIYIGRTDTEAPIFWPTDAKNWLIGKDPDVEKHWRQKEKRVTEVEMVGCLHWLNGHELKQTLEDSEGQGSPACYSPWGHKELDTTEWLNNNKATQVSQHTTLNKSNQCLNQI